MNQDNSSTYAMKWMPEVEILLELFSVRAEVSCKLSWIGWRESFFVFVPTCRADLAVRLEELVSFNDADDFVHVPAERLVVHDHVIVGRDGHVSLKAKGLI